MEKLLAANDTSGQESGSECPKGSLTGGKHWWRTTKNNGTYCLNGCGA